MNHALQTMESRPRKTHLILLAILFALVAPAGSKAKVEFTMLGGVVRHRDGL